MVHVGVLPKLSFGDCAEEGLERAGAIGSGKDWLTFVEGYDFLRRGYDVGFAIEEEESLVLVLRLTSDVEVPEPQLGWCEAGWWNFVGCGGPWEGAWRWVSVGRGRRRRSRLLLDHGRRILDCEVARRGLEVVFKVIVSPGSDYFVEP